MTITQDPVTADSKVEESPTRPWWVVALIAVAALLVGAAFGYVLGNDGGDTADPITPDGAALTERQEEMVALVDGYTEAWEVYDVDASIEYMTPQASLYYPVEGLEFTVRDGSYQRYMSGLNGEPLVVDVPRYVVGDAVIQVFQVPDRTMRFVQVFDFAERDGELLINAVVETIYLLEAEAR